MADVSLSLHSFNGSSAGLTNGSAPDNHKSSHKSHKEKKHKQHKEHKHKKDKKEKHKNKDKHRDKDEKVKSSHSAPDGGYKDGSCKPDLAAAISQLQPQPTALQIKTAVSTPAISLTPVKPAGPTAMTSGKVNTVKDEPVNGSDDELPLKPLKRERPDSGKKYKPEHSDDDDEYDKDLPVAGKSKKIKLEAKASGAKRKSDAGSQGGKAKKMKSEPSVGKGSKNNAKAEPGTPDKKISKRELAREQEQKAVWKWWEEERKDDGIKWKTLEHKGPLFAPDYEPLPDQIKFLYNGKEVKLSPATEEVASFYAKMLTHDYTTKEVFNSNFMKDWRKVMNSSERQLITDLKKCDFTRMNTYFTGESEKRKSRSKEEKQKEKEKNEALQEEYGYCQIDGHREKIGNFRVEPPGLFRGRGDHPKMGMLKQRTNPEDVIINCGKTGKIPEPPKGHKWKEVRHDNTVTWLACWTENIQGMHKYVMLNPASRLKGEKDWQKYEKARQLHKIVDKVRSNYEQDLKSKEMRLRQRAVALYFIDKLALRAGNEKDADEQADTVGCCSLRIEHINLVDERDGKECIVEFDFLGKDSIRYQNSVPVEKRVYKNLKLFVENKAPGDDLFDRLNTTILNKHLSDIMDGLTAKVFRTYNASRTLEEQLNLLTDPNDNLAAKMLSYNRANRAVAVLCNHQRAVPKNFSQQMERLQEKITAKQKELKDAKKELKDAKAAVKSTKSGGAVANAEKKQKAYDRIKEQLAKLEVQATDKDENKDIALGTSKLNYLDPRISIAWCKKYDVPIEKVYNKTQRQKFMWAVDMAGPDFVFAQ